MFCSKQSLESSLYVLNFKRAMMVRFYSFFTELVFLFWSCYKTSGMRQLPYLRNVIGSVIRLALVTLILLQQYWLVVTFREGLGSRRGNDSPFNRIHPMPFGGQMSIDSNFLRPSSANTQSLPIMAQQRFLIFRHAFTGQGAGNVLSGLLATHMLASEFNRTVCLDYPSFQKAFAYLSLSQHQLCQTIQQTHPPQERNTLKRNNYDTSGFSSECSLKERLQSNEESVLYFTGNTYPRWPNPVQYDDSDNFHHFYHPTADLLQYLPWTEAPHTVVHLRQADGDLDARPGLDHDTLLVLGQALSNGVFLVTNRVAWYDFFQQFGWSHPPWSHVQHSGLHLVWGNMGSPSRWNDQDLQLWADWYTLLRAKTIYHTPSDFSKSAARWNRDSISWTILGTRNVSDNESKLDLQLDFADDRGVMPLVRRSNLKYCNETSGVSSDYKDSRMANMLAMAKRRRESYGVGQNLT